MANAELHAKIKRYHGLIIERKDLLKKLNSKMYGIDSYISKSALILESNKNFENATD